MARIGETGTDEYVLDTRSIVSHNANKTLISEITARRSGKLYLYVNDVVMPFPKWQPFYENNRGTATVKVEMAK
jgi:hypothetical protein